MDPLTPLDTLCRIILRAREYEAQTPSEYDAADAADADEGDESALSVLDEETNDGVEEELRAALDDLGEDQLAEIVGFCWVGQGTYDVTDWDEAMAEANDEVRSGGAIDELLDMPMLASVMEAGMAAFDITCEGVGDLS